MVAIVEEPGPVSDDYFGLKSVTLTASAALTVSTALTTRLNISRTCLAS